MTVCIAAACEGATKVVVATDRLISYAGVVSESIPGKMLWLDDWLVLYAGAPSNTSLIIDTIHEVTQEKLTRANVQATLRTAYQRRKGLLSSFPSLSSYDETLEKFQESGLKRFGKYEFGRISQEIARNGREFEEQLLAVGWGDSPASVMLYEVSSNGDFDHRLSGIAAIGIGCDVALSTMMLLGQSRDSSLAETLYTVAAAKFASEKSTEGDVGKKTSMYITWKRTQTDAINPPPGNLVQEEHITELHKLWDAYGRPKISDHVFRPVNNILKSLGVPGRPSTKELNALMRLANQADSAESKE
jgi:hypothetical protein